MGKICILFGNYDHAGIARVAVEIGLRVQKHYQVDLVCRRILRPVEEDIVIRPLNSATTLHYWRDCAQLVAQYDIVHCHDVYALPGLVRAKGKAKIIYTEHGIVPIRYTHLKGWHGIMLAYTCAFYGIPKINLVTAISDYIARDLKNLYRARRVVKIPNGVYLGRFKPGAKFADVNENGPVLLKVGGLSKVRDPFTLLRAMPAIIKRLPKTKLLVAGSGPLEKKLKRKILVNGLAECVQLLGFVPNKNLDSIYSSCDILIDTSLCHGFGLPILEAMACGKPVVARNAYAMTEIVQTSGAGELFNGNDPEVITAAVEKIWSNYKAYAERARPFAEQYSWERVCEKYLELYDEALLAKNNDLQI